MGRTLEISQSLLPELQLNTYLASFFSILTADLPLFHSDLAVSFVGFRATKK